MRRILYGLWLACLTPAAAAAAEAADPQVCGNCHSEIAQAYRRTGMGRSLYKPAPTNTLEDYRKRNEFLHSLSDTHYAMIVRNGAYFQRRWQMGFDGRETNIEELRIDAVVGSGAHARSYLHRTASGGYVELPLGWYAEQGGYWAMSPGFNTNHPATRRFVSYECVFCHDAYPRIPAGHDAPGSDPVFAGDLPEGIDCQRCHGPGAKHVAAAQTARAGADEIRASIVNPARLTPALRMDLCMQCHLQPTSGAIRSLIRRFDQGPFSYTPGEPLEKFLLVFDDAPGAGHDDKFEIVNSSAYRLRKSACFLKSNGAMTCTTCHDPHGLKQASYSDSCRQCHGAKIDAAAVAGQHPPATECVSCHMQKRRTEDVVHAVMTDHWIQRKPAHENRLAELSERHGEAVEYRGEVVLYYPSHLPSAEGALYGAIAREAPADLARELARTRPQQAAFYAELGQTWRRAGKLDQALNAYQQAIQSQPDSVRTLIAAAELWKDSGDLSRAEKALQRAIEIAPDSPAAWYQAGAVDFSLGRTESALQKMERVVTLDPDLSGAHTGLAEILARTGQPGRAEAELRAALRIDPYDASAYNLIGRVLAGEGRTAQALFDLEKATRLRPAYAPHLYDYALALWSAKRFDAARSAVEAALRANPEMGEAHALLGRLLAGERQFPAAVREYAEAIRLAPDLARAHLDLARVLADEGDLTGATQHLRIAAAGSDQAVAELAAQALRKIEK
ncbi:MAG TPA: tetratricopeptide repeat protein [Bryobacteraceae bacterium]|nr:tetratricopeptide repeat protein [Bryobacteraceae bacterium]